MRADEAVAAGDEDRAALEETRDRVLVHLGHDTPPMIVIIIRW
jgi:hypothetical protein